VNQITQLVAQASEHPGIIGGTDFTSIVIGLLTGVAFGAILLRAGASSFTLITNMLRLKDLTVMKFFFLAIGVGSVGMYIVDAVGTANIGIAPFYMLGMVVGGIIFGIGWAVSGYCPGTALVAMSQGKLDAVVTVLGGLSGALVLALTWDYIEPVLVEPLNYGSKSVPEVLGARPLLVAVVFGLLVVAVVAFLDNRDKRRNAPADGETRPITDS
jgi:uncharacterized membrane protein YedE/YeeE